MVDTSQNDLENRGHQPVDKAVDKGCGYVDKGVDKVFHRGARRSKPVYKSPAQRGGDNLYTGYTQKPVDNRGCG